jgi:multidrug efflux system membrane fusion protein
MKTRDGIILVVGLAAAGPACARVRADKAPARPVWVETVQGAATPAGLRYSATIQPYEQVPLAFKVGGYVRQVRRLAGPDGRPRNLQQGDVVTRGTVLARLDAADYQERVNQARAQVAEAEATLAKGRADASRAESLYREQALTRPDYDAATANLAVATARVGAARAQLESAEIALRDTVLVAPADGVVLSRSVEVGTLAGAGTVGFVLADLARVKAVFGVPDRVVERVQVGSPLGVTSDALGTVALPGRVTAVSPSADAQSRVFSIEVTIPNAERRLKAGMIATVEVSPSDLPDIAPGTPTVSVAAVVKSARPGGYAVFLAEGSGDTATARAREVKLGRIAGNRVAVEAGLEAGDRVIVSGASLVTDGDAVRVIPGSEGE